MSGGSTATAAATPTDADWTALRSAYKAYDQLHVFEFYDRLTSDQRTRLYQDLKSIDLKHVMENFALIGKLAEDAKKEVVTPFPHTTVAADLKESQRIALRESGLALIAAGKVCAILMAGGQGTRLGSDRPKGCYDIGLPSHKSLFQLQAERIIRLKQLAVQHATKTAGKTSAATAAVSLPWYIMTSPQTDKETREYFAEKKNFGLPAADIMYFCQANLPCLTPTGKIILETPYGVSQAPNGNGGVYAALKASGCLADMKKRGVEYSHFYGVDNAMVKVADPMFIAFCVEQKAECANKVVLKRDWSEKVGVMCLRNGRSSVIEYSEITREQAQSTDTSSEHKRLLFGAANIVQHFFTRDFLEQTANDLFALPFHVASKKIPCVDPVTGATVTPLKENGIKLEMFVFDSFVSAKRCVAFAVPRDGEFTAVKNAAAPGVQDSPVTARLDISAYHMSLMSKNVPSAVIIPGPTGYAQICAGVERLALHATKLAAAGSGADSKAVTAAADTTLALSSAITDQTLFELSPLLTYDGEGLSEHFSSAAGAAVHRFVLPCEVGARQS